MFRNTLYYYINSFSYYNHRIEIIQTKIDVKKKEKHEGKDEGLRNEGPIACWEDPCQPLACVRIMCRYIRESSNNRANKTSGERTTNF